jgi:hypothetical protein
VDSRSDSSALKPNGDDSVVTSTERSPNVESLDGQEFVVRLKEGADGYFSVQGERVRRPRVLADKAEYEIMRIQYLKSKNRVLEAWKFQDLKPKRCKSSGKVWFTTLADVTRQEGDANVERPMEATNVEADDHLFLQFLREVDSRGSFSR